MNGLGDTDVPREFYWCHCFVQTLTGHLHKTIRRNIHDRDQFGRSWEEEYGSALWGIYADLRCRVSTQIFAVVRVRRSKTLPAGRVAGPLWDWRRVFASRPSG